MVGLFTANHCDITSNRASLIPGITQPGCPNPPDDSIACRTVSVDTSIIKDYDPIQFTAEAEDGSTIIS